MAPRTENTLPAFVISLDFELRWGVHDRLGRDMDLYRRELEGAREAIPMLLGALAKRGLRATWATVGALACRGWDEYFRRAPKAPRYQEPALAFDPAYAELDPEGLLHFAPELVERIRMTLGQELGTHTFSHLPFREPGVTENDVKADLAAVAALWEERFGGRPKSLAFPRNQCAFPEAVTGVGIRIWRGNPAPWYYDANEAATNGVPARALRLLDDLSPWGRRGSAVENGMSRASLFLRLNLPAAAWRLHVRNIRRGIAALRPGEVFHVWWHPHNCGADVPGRVARVCEVLDLAAEEAARGRIASRSMGELAA